MKNEWYVYIVECVDGTFYTGISSNVEKRLEAHNTGKGAKYTKGRVPVVLRYFEKIANRSKALMCEYELKQMSRGEKLKLIERRAKGVIES